ncbi:lysosomal acid glucosylceramidase-like [Planococcus citri]|uniref:lysosomal acid glucosylceramidase-like n=1 Tax=Planococcus citri TaxID=170843 RepID=UPI0031F9FBE7
MTCEKLFTRLNGRSQLHRQVLSNRKLANNAVLHFLLAAFLLKVEQIHSQSTETPYQSYSNVIESSTSPNQTIPNFSPSGYFKHTIIEPHVPITKQYATETTRSLQTNSVAFNTTMNRTRSQDNTFQKSVSSSRILNNLKLAKIDPPDSYQNTITNIKSLDMIESGDSFTKPQIKSDKWVNDSSNSIYNGNKTVSEYGTSDNGSITNELDILDGLVDDEKSTQVMMKIPKPLLANSTDDFCRTNNSEISFNRSDPSIAKVGNSNDYDFCNKSNSDVSFNGRESTKNESNADNDFCKSKSFATRPKVKIDGFLIDEEELKLAEKMTECIPKNFQPGRMVCVCNKTYCDKMLPLRPLPSGKFSWYRSSSDGYRFNRHDGQLSQHTKDVKDALKIDTTVKLQKIMGFGGAFSDSASGNIWSLSPLARKQLMQSYYGPFGLQYVLGRVPIGGTDFSSRFYTNMDTPKKFKLSEQDLKHKIPTILEAMELTRDKLKLMACSWTAPKWMKTNCSHYSGELKREYCQLYADYLVMFLDNYAKNNIKFWALSTGNKPMVAFNFTETPFINAMEWSPYKQSKWVTRYLVPTLRNSSHQHLELIIGEENREIIAYFVKWFFEPLVGEKYHNLTNDIVNEAYFHVSGISIHGYTDTIKNNLFLNQMAESYPEKYLLLAETACYGKPQLGAWNCAERYAMQIMDYLYHSTSGFVDWNLALDLEGGPNYLNNYHDAAITVDSKNDVFYKQPMYYVIGHFSKFIAPDSVRVYLEPFNTTFTGISAIAAQRPDNAIVIVAYNRSPQVQNTTFLIDKKHTLSLNLSARSINTVIFWQD